MNLYDTYTSIEQPEKGIKNIFNAITVVDYPFVKIAKNIYSFPVILITSLNDGTYLTTKNVRLKYIELKHNQECKISEGNKTKFENFTVIVFNSDLPYLQNYFLGIAETLIKSLSSNPTQKEILAAFNNFIDIFRVMSDIPRKSVQGLWAELFIIEKSKNIDTLLDYWHNIPTEKFDFNAGIEKLEVKSNSRMERIHIFSSEQLNPPDENQVIIASLYTKQKNTGTSINDLIKSIIKRNNNSKNSEKLFEIVSKTLGNTIEQSIKIKFDYHIAENSLKFYKHQDVSKIEEVNIPSKVSEVRYKSDLTKIKDIIPKTMSRNIGLFDSI